MEAPARNPEHEPARRRLLLLTLGSRHYPGRWSAPCSLLPAALARLQARSRSAALVGFPHLFWSDPGCQAPGSTADNDPGPQPRKGANPKEPWRHGRRQAFHVGICLLSCWSLSFAARARQGPLLCSDLSSRPTPSPKLISLTCQFALVWKILKTLEMFRDPAAPGSLQFCLARAVGRSRGCGVCLEPTSQPCSLVPPWPSPKLPDAARRATLLCQM